MLKMLNGVGDKTLYQLNNNGIYTIEDLLFSFPKNYLVYKHSPEKLFEGNDCYLEGIVDSNVSMFKYKKNTFAFSFYLKFDNLRIKMDIFSNIYVGIKIKKGQFIGVYGKYHNTKKQFNIKKLFIENVGFKIETDYKLKDILNSKMSKLIDNALKLKLVFSETLPDEIIKKYKLLEINDYIYKSHFPNSINDMNEAIRRRKYEEFYWYSISLSYIRNKRIVIEKNNRNINLDLKNDFINNLSFDLTVDQIKAIDDVICDLNKPFPMNRLIEGDVGCGKTIVGIISALLMTKSNYQVACLAPTEVLAIQEYNEFKKYLDKYNVKVGLLTSGVKKKDAEQILREVESNAIDILVGTHSILNDRVKFNNLGLAIIDEQHRFGVNQRLSLVNKYDNVDSLFFSATPIPRTLGLTFLKDLDVSSIKTLPKGKKEIVTKVLPFSKLNSLFKSISNHLAMGEKAYVVVPLIENDENNYMDVYECEKLFKSRLDNIKIGVLHGKMKSLEKDKILNDFRDGNYDILISTTVIEVGVNITDATMMIIMNAERFGLATLHQLRGRVGRGTLDSYCMLISDDIDNPRLKALSEISDGFQISEIDFKLRGPGDYLGSDQSGYQNLEYASFTEDLKILKCAKSDSEIMISKYLDGTIKSELFDKIVNERNELDKIN
ncbi:MAG: ATP-dependent DNA helicase RecG [Acholeplasmatales bacterium]|nr:ATP-dependent DNA helicase RecG [Acholeplasmatales bacterium]